MPTLISQVKPRAEISQSDQWNVNALYPTLNAWEQAFSKVTEQPSSPFWPSIAQFRGRLKEGPAVVKSAFEKIFSISRELEKLYTYAHLRHDEEITIDASKSAYQKSSALFHDFGQETSWLEPELLSLPTDLIDQLLLSPELSSYRFHLEKIVRMRPHTLSADKEELLAMAGKPLQSAPKAFSALNNADLKFGTIKDQNGQELELSHGLYQLYLRSTDRTLRQNAFLKLHGKYAEFENTLCELIYGEMQTHHFFAKARHYRSSLEAALYPKKIDESVYRSLIQAVRQEGLPALHRYMHLRKRLLGVSELHPYDLYVPLVPHVDIQIGYDEAESLVIESAAPLGHEYQSLLRKGLKEEKWIDRFENKNKRSGAYSSGCYDSYPYILMNYKEILKDAFTLAHEAGHSMHSLLSRLHQPYHYYHYPIFVAEVASTFNEELLMHLLLAKRQKKEEKRFLLNEKIEDIRGTLFRQTMFAEFELKLHELVEGGTPLTPTLLKDIYLQLNQDYFGPAVTLDPELSIEWARVPHFYYNFYVYQYATGLSATLSLSQKVLTGDLHARDNYLAFLRSGGSLHPIDLLKVAGVDMASPLPVQEALGKFNSLISEFEKLS